MRGSGKSRTDGGHSVRQGGDAVAVDIMPQEVQPRHAEGTLLHAQYHAVRVQSLEHFAHVSDLLRFRRARNQYAIDVRETVGAVAQGIVNKPLKGLARPKGVMIAVFGTSDDSTWIWL